MCVFIFGGEKRVSGPIGAGVTGGCDSPYMVLGLNSGSLQEQEVLLAAEPSQLRNLMTRNSLHKH